MNIRTHRIILIILAICMVGTVSVGAKKKAKDATTWEMKARKNLSDYIFMEAARQNALGASPEVYLRHLEMAHELDSTDAGLNAEISYFRCVVSADTNMWNKGYKGLQEHFNAFPEDYYFSTMYVTAARQEGDIYEVVRAEHILDSIFNKTDITLKYAQDLALLYQYGDTTAPGRALDILNRLETGYGKEPWLLTRKIRVHAILADTVSIIREVTEAVEDAPNSLERNIFAASMSMLFDNDKTLGYLDRATELDSTDGRAYYLRAEYYRNKGDSISYDREVFRALRQESLDFDTKMEMLNGYVRELYKDSTEIVHARIRDLFDFLVQKHPHESELRSLYGSYLMTVRNPEAAAEQFQYAVDADPSDSEYWGALLSIYLQTAQYDKLIEQANRAKTIFPENSWYAIMESLGYHNTDNIPQAIAILEKSLENPSLTETQRSSLLQTIADFYYADNQNEKAFEIYNKALELDPTNIVAMNNLAYHLACSATDLERALQLSEYTIKSQPTNATYLDTYAWVLFQMKEYQKAKKYIDMAIEAVEASDEELSAEMLEHAGDIYFLTGEPDQAVGFWESALEGDPDNQLLKKKVQHKTFFFK